MTPLYHIQNWLEDFSDAWLKISSHGEKIRIVVVRGPKGANKFEADTLEEALLAFWKGIQK